MKNILFFLAVFFLPSGLFAANTANPVMVLEGNIIDNKCAAERIKELAVYVSSHTKECALTPASVKSGYSLHTGTALLTFDGESTGRIQKYLEHAKSRLSVQVKVELYEDKMRLIEIGEIKKRLNTPQKGF